MPRVGRFEGEDGDEGDDGELFEAEVVIGLSYPFQRDSYPFADSKSSRLTSSLH